VAVGLVGCGATGSLGSADGSGHATVAAPNHARTAGSGKKTPQLVPLDRGKARRPAPPPIADYAVKAAAKLPLDQQVGQLFMVGFPGTDLSSPVFEEVTKHGWGAISIAGANAPTGDLYALFSGEAVVRARDAERVPPLMLAQLDGGPEHLGATAKQGFKQADEASALSQAAGITFAIQPRIDVGIGADQKLISRVAPRAVEGWLKGNVMTAVAHFPGQGTATQDPIDGPASVGEDAKQLAQRDLLPFKTALKVSPAVTVSSAAFSAYDPINPASIEPSIVRGLLRDKLRYAGVAMTDDIASVTAATGTSPSAAAVAALNAGIDMVYVPEPGLREKLYKAVLGAVKDGKLSRARVREAVARILVLKRKAGLFTP
jgi:beta-N-acetylhexosaminidase